MIAIQGLDHIGIRIVDFNRTIAFYQQFGFEVIREDYVEKIVVLCHASGLELNLLDSATRQQQSRNVLMDESIKYPGYTHVAMRVADITHAARYVRALGIEITEGPVTFGDGKTSIFFRDPDRNVIELTQLPLTHAGSSRETAI
ncbi:MAG: VOC family protein [Gammaproteobacteria bacterium]|jgi:catechol 2,3-dioxygenase-like lactoylglutathione lyase family enzyme